MHPPHPERAVLPGGDDPAPDGQAAESLHRDWLLTVAGRAGITNDALRTLIKKFPISLAQEAEKYESEINESEVLNMPLRWDFDQMTSILAVLLRRKPIPNEPAPPPFPSVNATEQRGRPTCPCCGQQGHVAKECPTVCNVCNEKACPGNAGGNCIVCTSADIPAVVKRSRTRRNSAAHDPGLVPRAPGRGAEEVACEDGGEPDCEGDVERGVGVVRDDCFRRHVLERAALERLDVSQDWLTHTRVTVV